MRVCNAKSFRADYVGAITWGWVVDVLENREKLGKAFSEYLAMHQNNQNPVTEDLSRAKKMLMESKREMERLVVGFVNGLVTKTQMKTRKAKLDSRMEKQSEEIDALTAETQQAIYREDYVNSIEEYADKVSGGLERAEEDIRVKREVLRRLGANLRLIEEGATKYAEILFLAPNHYAETVPLRGLEPRSWP